MTSKAHDGPVIKTRKRRWALAVLAGLAGVAVLLTYSIGDGLSQLAAVVAGLEDWSAQSQTTATPSVAIKRPSAPAATDERVSDANQVTSPPVPTLERPAAVAPSVATPPAPAVYSNQDVAAFRARLETLLASDPETLEAVQQLFDERDPAVLAENVRLLRDTFGVE